LLRLCPAAEISRTVKLECRRCLCACL
jgi:hypothetical protein